MYICENIWFSFCFFFKNSENKFWHIEKFNDKFKLIGRIFFSFAPRLFPLGHASRVAPDHWEASTISSTSPLPGARVRSTCCWPTCFTRFAASSVHCATLQRPGGARRWIIFFFFFTVTWETRARAGAFVKIALVNKMSRRVDSVRTES